jgi:hypothetical protein
MRMRRLRQFASELFRRKVVRLVGAYIAVFWLLAQGYASLYPAFGAPDWTLRAFIVAGIAAIPVLAFFSWKYDIVPPQIIKDPKDIEADNPALSWAMIRHDNFEAGYVLVKWQDNDGAVKERRFFKPVSIGRQPNNDIELPDQRVSRHHAVLWAEQGTWRVRDLESANGTFIGHARVAGTAPLPQSCELRFHPNGPTVSIHIDTPAETLVG